MAILLVTYDLNKPGQEYDEFYEIIKSYAIDTTDSPAQIYEKLSPHLDTNDFIYYYFEETNLWLWK